MFKIKKSELIRNIHYGEDSYLNLKQEDAFKLANILIPYGFAVLITAGDIGDDYKVSWVYAGDVDSLNYADRNNVIFSSYDNLDMLLFNDYIDDDDDAESNVDDDVENPFADDEAE